MEGFFLSNFTYFIVPEVQKLDKLNEQRSEKPTTRICNSCPLLLPFLNDEDTFTFTCGEKLIHHQRLWEFHVSLSLEFKFKSTFNPLEAEWFVALTEYN